MYIKFEAKLKTKSTMQLPSVVCHDFAGFGMIEIEWK